MSAQTIQASSRILIADDDPVIRQQLASILRQEGHSVITASDGREAIRILQGDADFKAAIFAVMMPHLEGTEIIRHMRTEKRLMRIPVILITSDRSLTLMKDGFAAGATAFLSKPFQPQQMQAVVRMLLSRRGGKKGAPLDH